MARRHPADDPEMFVLQALPRVGVRLVLARTAQAVAVDALPDRRRARSRQQHLRNGVAALLEVASFVAWRPGLLATMFYPTRERVRSELRYGLDELLRAGAIQRSRSRTPGLLVVVATGGAATTALLMRKRRSIHDRTQEEAAPALDEPVPVRAGD